MKLEDEMLTHISKENQPTMVDITRKEEGPRSATAQAIVKFPRELDSYFNGKDFVLKKGAVFETAIVAGTMAVKKTYEIIPFCHQIPVESIKFSIKRSEDLKIEITCTVKTTYKTGVEMEALHGATVAALTIYDMCKAVTHDILISSTKLVSKTGGKNLILDKPLFGLVLTGGKSKRMQEDKALLKYHDKPHAIYMRDILLSFCQEVFLSSKDDQWTGTELESLPQLYDSHELEGPMAGLITAMRQKPDAYWIVVACDLPYFSGETVSELLKNFDASKIAIAFKNRDKGFSEPLCTLYTPKAKDVFESAYDKGIRCPVKVLRDQDVIQLNQLNHINLANVNTPTEYSETINEL
jgi:cyclic pyranopterin phosphate synthase